MTAKKNKLDLSIGYNDLLIVQDHYTFESIMCETGE